MTAPVRWLLVALVAIAVVAPVTLVRVLPASGSDLSATQLATKIKKSTSQGWSGEVTSLGSLAVPATDAFGQVSRLLGATSDLRVWWHDPEHWRVDRTRASGESDLVRKDNRLVRWSYESRRATVTRYSEIRLPAEVDVLPSTLAARLLQGAKASELSRLPAQRVAGHSSAGLRLTPAGGVSTIDHVDVWADEATGVPTRVDVYSGRATVPVLSTRVTRFEASAPPLSRTAFDFPKGIRVNTSYALDDAAGANAFAPFTMPDSAGGLARRGDPATHGAVGVYGRGPASLLVIPLRRNIARDLYTQLSRSKDAHTGDDGIDLAVGPLSVLLTRSRVGNFLITGTVTPATLVEVGASLRDGVKVVDR
jgi:hypothetical protein